MLKILTLIYVHIRNLKVASSTELSGLYVKAYKQFSAKHCAGYWIASDNK